MTIVEQIRNNGTKKTLQIIWNYKVDAFVEKLFLIVLKHKPLQDIIIIESHNDFDSHGGAFYDYLIKKGYNKKYKIVWFLRNECPDLLPENVYGIKYDKKSITKIKYHCLAKYIICGHHKISSIREDQISVFTSHGSFGLKNATGRMKLPNSMTYYLCPSSNVSKIRAQTYGMEYPNKKELIVGFPGHDILYTKEQGDLHLVTQKHYTKVILWMPTFRRRRNGISDTNQEYHFGIPIISSIKDYNDLNVFLQEKNCLVILKIHPMQDLSVIQIQDLSNIIILDGDSMKKYGIDNYRLMKDMDAMISDYSSAAADFLHLDKPLAYTIDDIDDYKLGYVVEDPKELMAGHLLSNIQDMKDFISDLVDEKDPYENKRKEIRNYIFHYHDGNSSERLANFLKL